MKFLWIFLLSTPCWATTAATCGTTDVQSAITATSAGGTVTIPAGTCTWTSGVTISGKGLVVSGAGSGRIVAYDTGTPTPTVGTGTKTFTIAGFSTGFTSATAFVNGSTMTALATGDEALSMTGTVTSYSAPTLTMNITATTGSGSTHRWIFATASSTILVNNSATPMFAVTEDTAFDTNLSGFKIQVGTGAGDGVDFNYTSGGKAIVLQNCWIQQSATGDSVLLHTNRGVISNCSFDSATFSLAPLAIHCKGAPDAWTQASFWGTADTTGQNNYYVETSDFEAYLNAADNDDNCRAVFRYNLQNNAGYGTHGADTSNYGQRYFEAYNNVGLYNGYSDGTTFNMNWWFFVRGGSYVVHDNTYPALVSTDYGTKADVLMIAMNLQRNAGPNPCWGAGGTAGQYYYVPRQVGMGRVTGAGTTAYPADGVNGSTDSITYVGDSEPAYIWNNSRQPLGNTQDEDYGLGIGGSCPGSPTPDSTSNYVVAARDYFNTSTAKPGYTPYQYPHPLLAPTSTVASGISGGNSKDGGNGRTQ